MNSRERDSGDKNSRIGVWTWEMRKKEESGIMPRCLSWVAPLAEVRKKRAGLGRRMMSSVLDMPNLRLLQGHCSGGSR